MNFTENGAKIANKITNLSAYIIGTAVSVECCYLVDMLIVKEKPTITNIAISGSVLLMGYHLCKTLDIYKKEANQAYYDYLEILKETKEKEKELDYGDK